MSTTFMSAEDLEWKIRKDNDVLDSSTFTLIQDSEELKKKLFKLPAAPSKSYIQKALDSKAPYVWIVAVEETESVPQRADPTPRVTFYEYHTKTNSIKKLCDMPAV